METEEFIFSRQLGHIHHSHPHNIGRSSAATDASAFGMEAMAYLHSGKCRLARVKCENSTCAVGLLLARGRLNDFNPSRLLGILITCIKLLITRLHSSVNCPVH